MEKITVFEAFAGYGSQSMALERLKQDIGLDYTVVGISEIDATAIKAYYAARDAELLSRCRTVGDVETAIRGGTSLHRNLSTDTRIMATSAKSTGRMCRISICSHTAFLVPTSAMPAYRKDSPRGLAQGHRFFGSAQGQSKPNTPNTS